mmetsp:Transcript_4034/g.7797  ORF Transcript_4034/g.7797 Transcript_4034/m.7797 type:complete len:105 (-) Transcript_4034:259-573(-)
MRNTLPDAIPKVATFKFVGKYFLPSSVGPNPVLRAQFGPCEAVAQPFANVRDGRLPSSIQHQSRLFTVQHLLGIRYTVEYKSCQFSRFLLMQSPSIPFLPLTLQ